MDIALLIAAGLCALIVLALILKAADDLIVHRRIHKRLAKRPHVPPQRRAF